MDQVFDVADLITAIEQARIKVAEASRGAYGAKVAYAGLLNQKWDFDWFELQHNDSSDEGKAVRKEKEAFYEILKGDKHSNPHKIWGDIRKYAKADRYPAPPVIEGADGGEGEGGEQGSDNAKHNRSPQLRNLEELTALFKFNRRQDSLSDELKQCQAYIAKALESLGVDIGMIGD
jgi:hypothetical protein